MTDLVSWMNMETLMLLFSMMIIIAILTETGVFDYVAVYTYKVHLKFAFVILNDYNDNFFGFR